MSTTLHRIIAPLLMTLAGAMLFGCDTGAPTSGASSTDAAGGTTAGTPAQAGTASVTWTAPAADVNGATNVAGYRIYYGEDAGSLTHVVDVDGAEAVKFTINDLTPGVWYFAIADYNAEKVESPLSGIVQVTI